MTVLTQSCVEICGFVICGIITKICGFAIYRMEHLRNLQICDCGTSPNSFGFAIFGLQTNS